jgi:hypothetical protein
MKTDQESGVMMVHPNARKGRAVPVPGQKNTFQGIPDMFPPVWVMGEDQEAQYRAKGYILSTEQPKMNEFQAYPAWMTDGNEEKLASSEREASALESRGFRLKGAPDPDAYSTAVAAPGLGDYVPDNSIRWENGHIVGMPVEHTGPIEYPKWVRRDGKEVIANDAAHEKRILTEWGAPDVAPKPTDTPQPDVAAPAPPPVPVLKLSSQTPVVGSADPVAEAKKQAARDRMAKARAARKPKAA